MIKESLSLVSFLRKIQHQKNVTLFKKFAFFPKKNHKSINFLLFSLYGELTLHLLNALSKFITAEMDKLTFLFMGSSASLVI